MSDGAFNDVFLMMCDWRGQCVWISTNDVPVNLGDPIWAELDRNSQETAKLLVSQVVTLGESTEINFADRFGQHYRGRMWALNSPETAVCIVGMRVPGGLDMLTDREQTTLQLLAQGLDTREIAARMDVSVNTIHTHLRRSREKLNISSIEALISFAARYCYPLEHTLRPVLQSAGD